MLLGLLLDQGLPSALAFDLHARRIDVVHHQVLWSPELGRRTYIVQLARLMCSGVQWPLMSGSAASSMWIMAYAQHERLPVPAVPRSRKLQDSSGMVPAAR